MPKTKISKKTKLGKLLVEKPEAGEILFEAGLSCVMCPMAQQETIEQGCKSHGMSNKEIDELIKKINKE